MKKSLKRLLLVPVLAAGLVVGINSPALAATSGACNLPSPNTANRATASAWIVYSSLGTRWERVHTNMAVENNAWTRSSMYVGGYSVDPTDGYKDIPPGTRTVKATWAYHVADGTVFRVCTFTLFAPAG